MADIFLALFPRSFHDMAATAVKAAQSKVVEVPEDGKAGQRFIARFPFSFYLNRLLESMRTGVEGYPMHDWSMFLQQQFEILQVPGGVDQAMTEELLRAYCHDVICLNMSATANVDRTTAAALVWHVLTLAAPVLASGVVKCMPPTLLSSIQTRFWACEQRLHAFLLLCDAVPAAQEPLVAMLSTASTGVTVNLDIDVAKIILHVQTERVVACKTTEDYANWLLSWKRVFSTVKDLISPTEHKRKEAIVVNESDEKAPEDAQNENAKSAADSMLLETLTQVSDTALVSLREQAERLQFFSIFIRDFGLPLRLAPELLSETIVRLQDVQLCSQSTLQLLLRVFFDLNKKFSRQSGVLECVICTNLPVNPVRFCSRSGCRRLVCQACADGYMSSAMFSQSPICFWCRQSQPTYVHDPADKVVVEESGEKELRLQNCASRVIEHFVFSICFKSVLALESSLLTDLINL